MCHAALPPCTTWSGSFPTETCHPMPAPLNAVGGGTITPLLQSAWPTHVLSASGKGTSGLCRGLDRLTAVFHASHRMCRLCEISAFRKSQMTVYCIHPFINLLRHFNCGRTKTFENQNRHRKKKSKNQNGTTRKNLSACADSKTKTAHSRAGQWAVKCCRWLLSCSFFFR